MIEVEEKYQLLQQTVREFNVKEGKRFLEIMDRENRFPSELPGKLSQYGLLGLKFPEEYGGAGMDALGAALVIEELGKVSPAIADVLVSIHASTGVILSFGSEEQKATYLPPVAEGRRIPAYALTESGAGSDLSGIQTLASKEGKDYRLNGAKVFVTLGGVADFALVLAITNPKAEKKQRGMSLFIVEGFQKGKMRDLMGIRGTGVSGMSFRNLQVPGKNLIGKENEGFIHIMQSLDGGRIEVAALSVGLAQGALDEAIRYAKQRYQFGKPIASFQAIQFMIADMQTKIDAARQLTYYAARLRDAGKPHSREASEAKLFASDVAMECVSESLQIQGGYGYTKEYPIEHLFRDAKINQIFEGTNQIQRLVIARNLLEQR